MTACTELEPQANAKTVAPTATGTTTPKGKRPDAGRKTTARILATLSGALDKAPHAESGGEDGESPDPGARQGDHGARELDRIVPGGKHTGPVSHPERIVPDETEPGIVAIHLKRYAFAEPWCRGKEVLDVACGVGYGTAHLAGTAARVVGGDLSEEAIAYAQGRYAAANVEFRVLDAAALPFPPGSFDAVCSFETIEHLPDREAYLGEVARVLRPAGVFLVSTPRADSTTERPDNPFHRIEYSREDFERLLSRHFRTVELYGQRRLQTRRHRTMQRLDVAGLRRRVPFLRRASVLVGTPPTAEATLDDLVIEPGDLGRASELVAVCTGPSAA